MTPSCTKEHLEKTKMLYLEQVLLLSGRNFVGDRLRKVDRNRFDRFLATRFRKKFSRNFRDFLFRRFFGPRIRRFGGDLLRRSQHHFVGHFRCRNFAGIRGLWRQDTGVGDFDLTIRIREFAEKLGVDRILLLRLFVSRSLEAPWRGFKNTTCHDQNN